MSNGKLRKERKIKERKGEEKSFMITVSGYEVLFYL
jgi:hypothetical protein